jgi:hypothetical protein
MCHFTTFRHAIVAISLITIFENFSGGGEMNKIHGKTIFTPNGLFIQKL